MRDDTIILYAVKSSGQRRCRVCVTGVGERGYIFSDYLCMGYSCASGYRIVSESFNNELHKIILSQNICKICSLRNIPCVGVDNCPINVTNLRNIIIEAIRKSRRPYLTQ